MVSVPVIVEQDVKIIHDLLDSLGLHRIRQDRWTVEQEPTVRDFYIEVGTVYGEITLRYKMFGKEKVQFHRIHLKSHMDEGLDLIHSLVDEERGRA